MFLQVVASPLVLVKVSVMWTSWILQKSKSTDNMKKLSKVEFNYLMLELRNK